LSQASRQQKRNHKRKQEKKVRTNRNELKGALTKMEFIQYMLQYESKLSILTGFIQSKYQGEFEEYVSNLEKESKEAVEEAESVEAEDTVSIVEDAEIIEETPTEETKESNNE